MLKRKAIDSFCFQATQRLQNTFTQEFVYVDSTQCDLGDNFQGSGNNANIFTAA